MSDTKIEVLDYYPQCIIEFELRRNLKRKWFLSRKYTTKGSWIVKGEKTVNIEFNWDNNPTGVEMLSAIQTVKNIIEKYNFGD